MRYRTERWVKLAARGRFKMETKARIGGKDYLTISAPKISRGLMSSPLSVGNCISATLNLSILTDDTILSSNPVVIMGRLTDDVTYSEWLEFGTFFINQRDDRSFDGLVTIDCFDAMLKANQSYLGDEDTSADWPKPMKEVVEEVAYRIGVAIDPRTRIMVGDDYMVSYPSGKTMIQVLGHIGACHGGNWIVTEENLLRLVPLITAPDETFHIITEDYEKIRTGDGSLLIYKEQEVYNAVLSEPTGEKPESVVTNTHYITDEYGAPIVTPEGYYLVWAADGSADAVDGLINIPVVCGSVTTGNKITITGVSIGNEGGEVFSAGSQDGTVLTIESNPYATQRICDDLYSAYSGLVYFPYTATKALYDPATELGDQVKIGNIVHSVLLNETLTLDHNFRADIDAPNSEELSQEYPHLSEIQRLKQSTESLNNSIAKTAEELTKTVETASADVETLKTALQDEIGRASGVEQELNSRIGNEETRAKAAEEALGSRVTTVDGKVDTLIGTDTGKSARTIANEELAKQLIAENAQESLDTLAEVAAWIQSHPADAAALHASITELRGMVNGLSTTLSGVSQKATDNATEITGLKATAADHETRVKALEDQADAISKMQSKITEIEAELIKINERLTALDGGISETVE